MSFLVPTRRYDERIVEMVDEPNADPAMLRDELKNLRRINKYFGGLSAIESSVLSVLRDVPDGREVHILDLGTGSADLPIHLVERSGRTRRKFHITAVENNPVVFQVARERASRYAGIVVERGNLLELDYPPKSFDVVLCSLTLHHFSNVQATHILSSMNTWSRVGLIVNDLYRSWVAAWSAKLYSLLTTRNPMTIYDSYLSVLRGFTREELVMIARTAGIQKVEIQTRPLFRIILLAKQ